MDKKKLEIIKIAIHLFSENGYHSTSVEEIAKESNMAKGSFYKYYQSKEDLLIDIINTIPLEIKQVLTKIYSKEYDSSIQKLSDLITVCYEKVFVKQIQILMSSCNDGALIKNQNIHDVARNISTEIDTLLSEFFINLYGEKIKDYVWNLNLLFTSQMVNYLILNRERQVNTNLEDTANFMATSIEILAEGYLERKPKPVIIGKSQIGKNQSDESPLVKGQKIRKILSLINHTVNNSVHGTKEKEEYMQVIYLLEEELLQKEQNTILIRAYISSLESIAELVNECKELKSLLEIEQNQDRLSNLLR
ncbi:AcrR family transcriptional regulator [Lysinibacillus composti]|uniref:TetR/AcrR family transcriptional regulator n=1 Tax=Lysinibacillus composti TaxID=720633 RepID=A0A3N9UHH7_9BACI|nr:TetR/AcrR family transcriptional regulator [Lysinibacillus composti]MBM7609084.1 AcrR family transcriptional regulator [Lysinibacillus composti]RQW75495.1 TetR/AcrR family transcriptional regulator [Lysinibacillus composti]